MSARIRELLEQGEINGQKIKDGKQVADLLAETILKGALKGDVRFVDLLLTRVEGKPAGPVADPSVEKPAPRIVVPPNDDRDGTEGGP